MHNRSQGAFLYTIEYLKYLSIYLKGMWKVIRYTDGTWEPRESRDAMQMSNDSSYA